MRVSRQRVVAATFYGGLSLLQALILLDVLTAVLPGPVAGRLSRNSEGYVFALLIAGWVQFVRPRLHARRYQWPITLAAAAACLAIGTNLYLSDYASRVKTLNEVFLAAAVAIPLVQPRRALRPAVGIGLSAVVLAVMIGAAGAPLVTRLAETFGLLLLLPVGLLAVDRGILDPQAATRTGLRYAWYALLVVLPVGLDVLRSALHFGGALHSATVYVIRFNEAFVALLLVQVYFAVGLGRDGAAASGTAGAGSSRGPDARSSAVNAR